MNKNLICEVDEGTRRMIEEIKSSVASGIEPSLTGNSKRIQELNYVADNILTSMQETKTGLLSKVRNILDGIEEIELEISSISTNLNKIDEIPDFSIMTAEIEKSIKSVENLDSALMNIKSDIREAQTGIEGKLSILDSSILKSKEKIGDQCVNISLSVKENRDLLNVISVSLEQAQSKIASFKEICETNNILFSQRIQESENNQIKRVTEIVSPPFEKIEFLLGEQRRLLSDLLQKALKTVESSKDDIAKQLQSSEANFSTLITSLKNMIETEREEREKYQLALDTKLNDIVGMLNSLNESVEDAKEKNEVHNVSITEKLHKILVMVTPFWKKKKSTYEK